MCKICSIFAAETKKGKEKYHEKVDYYGFVRMGRMRVGRDELAGFL